MSATSHAKPKNQSSWTRTAITADTDIVEPKFRGKKILKKKKKSRSLSNSNLIFVVLTIHGFSFSFRKYLKAGCHHLWLNLFLPQTRTISYHKHTNHQIHQISPKSNIQLFKISLAPSQLFVMESTRATIDKSLPPRTAKDTKYYPHRHPLCGHPERPNGMRPEDTVRCITGWCKYIHGMDPSIPRKDVSPSAPLYLILGGSHELKINLQDVKEIVLWKKDPEVVKGVRTHRIHRERLGEHEAVFLKEPWMEKKIREWVYDHPLTVRGCWYEILPTWIEIDGEVLRAMFCEGSSHFE